MISGNEDSRRLLLACFSAAVEAAQPRTFLQGTGIVSRLAALPPDRQVHVLGAGKSSAAMAAELERLWPRRAPPTGLVVTRDGYSVATQAIEVIEAGHPLPDERSLAAGKRVEAKLQALGESDYLVMLVSGGGSSLLTYPVEALRLEDLVSVTATMMKCGASVDEINIVRKHLTRLFGGKAALLAPSSHIDALILSDVVGDDPATIASGPVCGDSSTLADARNVLARYGVQASGPVAEALLNPANETPAPGDIAFSKVRTSLVRSDCWMAPVGALLQSCGYEVEIVDRSATGDARELAVRHAALIRKARGEVKRLAMISGGEATVTVRGDGIGGPNSEYALQLAMALDGEAGFCAIACDTDGSDGTSAIAGAIVDGTTVQRGLAEGLDAAAALGRSDSATFFSALGDAVNPGPTMTNVNDLRIALVEP